MGLRGKTVLVTRRHEQAGEMIEELACRGATPVVIPMIRIVEPEDWIAFDDMMRNVGAIDAVVFASTNAVEAFFKRLQQLNADISPWHAKRIYAVGATTSAALHRYGFAVEPLPESYSAEALASVLRKSHVAGRTFLLPQGNLARDILKDVLKRLGADVRVTEVYRNLPPADDVLTDLKRRMREREFDAVTFVSPSAVRNFARVVTPNDIVERNVCVGVIGPTTAQEARSLGFVVDVEARVATARGLVEALERYFDRTP